MMSESLAMLPVPNDGWLMPQDAERWLRELAPSYAELLMEGFNACRNGGDTDPWGLLAMDVQTMLEAATVAVFEGRQVRLERDESDRAALGHLGDLTTAYGQWMQRGDSEPYVSPAYDELCATLRVLGEQARRPKPDEPAEDGADAVREGA